MSIVDRVMMVHMAVSDMDRSKAFYTEKLGFEATGDYSQRGGRWVPLSLPGGGPSVVLTTYHENMRPGTMKLYISTPDVEAAFRELKARGVSPTSEVAEDPYGKRFSLSDPDGNDLVIQQS